MALPLSPVDVAARYVSDSRQDLTWGADPSADAWLNVIVQRSVDGGEWAPIARLDGAARNYSDNSTEGNHVYRYRLLARGEEGYSAPSDAVMTSTTPAAPNSVQLVRTGSSTYNVECDISNVRSAAVYRVQRWTPRAAEQWTTVSDVDAFPYGVEEFQDGVRYRVASVSGGLQSGYTESQRVNAGSNPDAPLVWGSVQDPVLNVGSRFSVCWEAQHNDGSQQASAQIELSIDGVPKTYTYNGSKDPWLPQRFSWAVPSTATSKPCTLSYRVRTKSKWSDYGSWSETKTQRVGSAPSAAFTSPTDGGTADRLPLVVTWTASSSNGIAYQELWLEKDAAGSDGAAGLVFRPAPSERSVSTTSVLFSNGSRWRAVLSVTDGNGTTVTRSMQFTISYKGPCDPSATVERGDGMSAVITVMKASDGVKPETDTLSVSRLSPDGSMWLVADGLLSGQQCIDPLPPLNTPFSYKVSAHAVSGAMATSDVECVIDSDGMEAYNFGPGASSYIELGYDASVSESVSHDGDTFRFALGPDTPSLPTFYPSGEMDANGRRSYVIADEAAYRKLAGLVRDPSNAVCWYRGAFGTRSFGTASWSLGYDASKYNLWSAACNFTECVWEDPSNG